MHFADQDLQRLLECVKREAHVLLEGVQRLVERTMLDKPLLAILPRLDLRCWAQTLDQLAMGVKSLLEKFRCAFIVGSPLLLLSH